MTGIDIIIWSSAIILGCIAVLAVPATVWMLIEGIKTIIRCFKK